MSHRGSCGIPAPQTPNPGTTTLLAHGPKTVPTRYGSAHDSAFIPTPHSIFPGDSRCLPHPATGTFPMEQGVQEDPRTALKWRGVAGRDAVLCVCSLSSPSRV